MNKPDKFEKLRKEAAELLTKSPPDVPETSMDMMSLIQELRIHQVELEVQNEELKRAYQELSDLKHEFENLYELAPCGYITLNNKGVVTRANLTAAALLEKDRGQLIHRRFSQFVHEGWEGDYFEARKKVELTGEKQSVDLRLKSARYSSKWVTADFEADRNVSDKARQWRMVIVDITARKEAEEALRKAYEDNKILLKELNHRVKNNMQVILSLFRLESGQIEDEKLKNSYLKMQNRILAMAEVHRNLHKLENLSNVDLGEFLSHLSGTIFQTYRTDSGRIKLSTEIPYIPCELKKVYPIGLMVNELISNALKYAFPGNQGGQIAISGEKIGDTVKLVVSDTGIGIPEGFDWGSAGSLGLRIVRSLVEQQLMGTIELESQPGTKWTITLPMGK